MKLAIAYSTKDRRDLWAQSLPVLALKPGYDFHIIDGSESTWRPKLAPALKWYTFHPNIRGGADAGIAASLSILLNHEAQYTHVGIVEQDVILDPDWFEPTIELFEKGKADGIEVGAVSARSYVDRVLIQRDGYAIMHNLGAGMVIFTRQAAEIVLRSFRTHWWPSNRLLFAQLSGIDLATYAAFRGNEQWVTTDWGWEAQLASHGLASLALTPAKCRMIGQNPPLEAQGLELTPPGYSSPLFQNPAAFELYRDNLQKIRDGVYKCELPGIIHRDGSAMLFFPHQLGNLAGAQWQGTLELAWVQGHGPFAYRAGPGGASLSVPVSGSCSFLVTGGRDGARVAVSDTRSGFNFSPDLPGGMDTFASINVPGGPIPRNITCELEDGAVLYGLQTADAQMLDDKFRFDWSQLPEAK